MVPSCFGGQQTRDQRALGDTYHRHYDGSIIVPELMHNPHAGDDPKEEKDQYDDEEGNGETEDCISPVALVAGHLCVLQPSSVKMTDVF